VPDRNQAYYVTWVRHYLQTEAPAVITSEKDRLRDFCEQLERGGTNQDWQIDQARRAVELYLNVYRKETAPTTAAVAPPFTDAESACARLQEVLRVRHYSIHTEHTYLDWVRRFLTYAKDNRLDWQAEGTVRS